MENYNVLDENWMPVRTIDGIVTKASPIELFKNLELYTSFAGDPVENYSMLRFMIALAQSSKKSQCKNIKEWKELKKMYAVNALEYMEANKTLFYMNGDKPFLLCTDNELGFDKKGKAIKESPIQLREQYAEGNNPRLYNMSDSSYESWDSIILDILVRQTYSVAYGKSGVVPTRSCIWQTSTLGIMNFCISGETLLDTIWLNFHHGNNFGIPVWESRFDDSYSITFLNRLVSLGSKIYISDSFDKMKCNVGINYPDIDDSSFMAMEVIKDEKIPMRFVRRSKIWKEYSKVFNSAHQPESFKRLRGLTNIQVTTLASRYKLSMGAYTTEDFSLSTQCIPDCNKIDDPMYIKFYAACVKLSDDVLDVIVNSYCGVRTGILFPNAKPSKHERSLIYGERDKIVDHFWNYLDSQSAFLFQANGINDDVTQWKKILNNGLSLVSTFINDNYGTMTSYKFSQTKGISNIRGKLLEIYIDKD